MSLTILELALTIQFLMAAFRGLMIMLLVILGSLVLLVSLMTKSLQSGAKRSLMLMLLVSLTLTRPLMYTPKRSLVL